MDGLMRSSAVYTCILEELFPLDFPFRKFELVGRGRDCFLGSVWGVMAGGRMNLGRGECAKRVIGERQVEQRCCITHLPFSYLAFLFLSPPIPFHFIFTHSDWTVGQRNIKHRDRKSVV